MSGVSNGAFTRTYSYAPQRDTVQPRFHIEAVQDELATAQQGRSIFRQEERVQIIVPGSPNSPVFRVTEEHKQRWPEHYKAFKDGQEMSVSGTPLEQWPILNRAQVLELKHLGFHNVEQLAEAPDVAVQRIGMGGQRMRDLARGYLDEAENQALAERLNHRNAQLEAQVASQGRQIDELRQLVERLHGEKTTLQNRPSEIETYIPSQHNPIDLASQRQAIEPAAPSALDALPEVRRRGRPPKVAA